MELPEDAFVNLHGFSAEGDTFGAFCFTSSGNGFGADTRIISTLYEVVRPIVHSVLNVGIPTEPS
jgi:hypothetical protein